MNHSRYATGNVLKPLFLIIICASLYGQELPGAGVTSVVAVVNGKPISSEELHASVKQRMTLLEQQRFQILEDGLNQLIHARLLDQVAADQGISVDELWQKEIKAKVKAVSEADLKRWYQANQHRVNQPLSQIAGRVRSLLAQENFKKAEADYFKHLRSKAAVGVYLEPQRVDIPQVGAGAKGPEDAPARLVAFSDFQCSSCRKLKPTLEGLAKTYGSQLRIEFRHLPLSAIHPFAQVAAEASLCAQEQGSFWELHDTIYENQAHLNEAQLGTWAENLGLDMAAFSACMQAGTARTRVYDDIAIANQIGVTSTPTFFVNGREVVLLANRSPQDQIAEFIDNELERAELAKQHHP